MQRLAELDNRSACLSLGSAQKKKQPYQTPLPDDVNTQDHSPDRIQQWRFEPLADRGERERHDIEEHWMQKARIQERDVTVALMVRLTVVFRVLRERFYCRRRNPRTPHPDDPFDDYSCYHRPEVTRSRIT
jgi:hypothetical protein